LTKKEYFEVKSANLGGEIERQFWKNVKKNLHISRKSSKFAGVNCESSIQIVNRLSICIGC
jgi:hypothetical protein